MVESVGGSLTGVTVRRKTLVARAALVSVTMMVMSEVPNWFVTGVSVSVRLVPEPPSERPESGRSARLVEVKLRLSSDAGVSGSKIVKASGPATPSSGTVWLAMAVMVGGWLVKGGSVALPWKTETTSAALSVAL